MTELGGEEYRSLRHAIAVRGALRPALAAGTVAAWAAVAAALRIGRVGPLASLPPLLVLAAGFEAVVALHVGVERIGRYLQVTYERPPAPPAWEHAVMSPAVAALPSAATDALFSWIFLFGAAANLLTLVHSFSALAWAVATAHVAFAARILGARRTARRQRTRDLEAFARCAASQPDRPIQSLGVNNST